MATIITKDVSELKPGDLIVLSGNSTLKVTKTKRLPQGSKPGQNPVPCPNPGPGGITPLTLWHLYTISHQPCGNTKNKPTN
jgi:hypothetical protein